MRSPTRACARTRTRTHAHTQKQTQAQTQTQIQAQTLTQTMSHVSGSASYDHRHVVFSQLFLARPHYEQPHLRGWNANVSQGCQCDNKQQGCSHIAHSRMLPQKNKQLEKTTMYMFAGFDFKYTWQCTRTCPDSCHVIVLTTAACELDTATSSESQRARRT